MQQIVPSQPGLFVIDVDEDYEIRNRYPVVAFSINEDSLNPIKPISILGRHDHYVLLYPDGQVFCNLKSDKRLRHNPSMFCRRTMSEDGLQMLLNGVQKLFAEAETTENVDEPA